jgi:acyl-CoA thioester hydrolase
MAVHRHRFRVRYGETDQMGFVHHSVYPLYFEEGRTGLMRDLGRPYAALEASGVILPVTEMALRFRTPARYDEELIVEARVTDISGARVRFDYRVLHAEGGGVACEGHTVLASIGDDGRPRRLPPDLAALLESAIEPPPPAIGKAPAPAAAPSAAPARAPDPALLRSGIYLRVEEMTRRWAALGGEAGDAAEQERKALETAIAREVARDLEGVLADLRNAEAPAWRRTAARGLGFVGDPRVRPGLEPLLAEADARLRNDALVSLARIAEPATSPEAEDRILALLGGDDGEIRGNAALCLTRIWRKRRREGREPVPDAARAAVAEGALLQALVDPGDAVVRSQAAGALGALGTGGAEELLVNAVRDPDAFVRLSALHGLASCGTTRVVEPVLQALEREAPGNLRTAAALALGAIHERAGRAPPLGDLGTDAARWREWLSRR